MKKTIFTLSFIFILALNFSLQADGNATSKKDFKKSDANIFGHVVDKKTGEHLPYVNVFLKGTTIGTTTDVTGHYFLKNMPEGKFELAVSITGYKDEEISITLEKGKTLEVNFDLEEEAISLNAVVVSANRNETNRQFAASLVSVLDTKMLLRTNSGNMAQALNFQPGLRVEDNCQNCGFSQVRINGLEGHYSQILIDSRPIYGALTGVYGLEQIPTNMIEQIEVIRGGGSALFGSSAIGGVINLITKEPKRNTGNITNTTSFYGGNHAKENNTMFNASLVTDNRKAGLMLYGQNRERQGYDHNGDGFSEMPMLKNRSFGLRSYIKTGDYSKLSFEYHNMHEFRRGGDNFEKQPFQAEITEQLEHYINGGGINYLMNTPDLKNKINLYASAQHTLRKSYYGGGGIVTPLDTIVVGSTPDQATIEKLNENINNVNKRLGAYGRTTEFIYQVGGQYTRGIDNLLFLPAELTVGVENLSNALKDDGAFRPAPIDQTTHTTSAFLQNEWKNEAWSILIGGRVDKHSLVKKAIFSPRANVRYNPTGNLNLRLSYSEGFRAPQYFDEDLHIALADGEQIVHILSPDLKEERSRSMSGSVDYYFNIGDVQVNTLAEGFYTVLKDPFTDTPTTDENTKLIVNAKGDAARVSGVNLEARTAYKTLFDLQLGLTLQKSLFDEKQEIFKGVEYREFMRAPNTYGYFVATYKPVSKLGITLSGNYTGSMYVPHESKEVVNKVDSFFELGTKISYDFTVLDYSTLQLNAGVKNMFNSYQKDFDKGPDRDSAYIYGPASPRTVYVGLALTLN